MNYINPTIVRSQIASLLVHYPELNDDDEGLLLALGSETDAMELLEQLVHRIGETKAHRDGLHGYIDQLSNRADNLEHRIEAYRTLIMKIMETANITKAPLASATISMGHKAASLIITDRDKIPFQYRRQPPWEPDKIAIKRSLEGGATVPGCELSNRGSTLTIRTK